MIYLIYLSLGLFAGLLSGIFGIGGGLIIVPTLLFSFKFLNFSPEISMHMAIGTSLSIILVTVSSSLLGHHKSRNVDWSIFRKIFIGLIIGSTIGAQISSFISAKFLEIIFSIYVAMVAIKMFLDVKIEREKKVTTNLMFNTVGFIIGFKSSILGIGGGTISIPFLTWRGFPMKHAVGISAALGLPIAVIGTIANIVAGMGKANLPEHSLGYIYIPAFIGVILTSTFAAQIGAKLSHKLPQDKMKRGFALFLAIVAFKMIQGLY